MQKCIIYRKVKTNKQKRKGDKMKKIISSILALSMIGACGVYADSVELPAAENEVMLISEETQAYTSDKRIVEGVVKSVSETQIEIDSLALNVDENTLVADTELVPAEVKEGDIITAVASTMETRSIPAQSYAYYIIVRENAETAAPMYMTVGEVKDGFIVSEDGNYEVTYETADVSMYKTKNIVKAEELTRGSEIFVYAPTMTMSIPALVNAEKIVVKSIASGDVAAEDEENAEVVAEETAVDKRIVEGTVKSVADGQIEIEELVLNIDESTLVVNTELVPAEVKEGSIITAVVSTAATFSLPAQSAAYYVIVRENAETPAPIYMTVGEVKDGFIYSQDGNYEVSYEKSEVAMYKTKNIVKAEELTEGSEIFVYADIMTMSIPALVNPSKIVIMSIAQKAEAKAVMSGVDKANALHELDILLGTENGLELDREVLRSEAVALIHRTSPADRMAYRSSFDDVPESHWAYICISWAVEKKIVEGVGNNKFAPDRTVTAKELSKMLFNALGEDVAFDNAYTKACEIGFITEEDGIGENDMLTREATAKIIYNYLNR